MGKKDKRIDAYISEAPDFAKPILVKVREMVHDACPDCEETLKWGHPTFMYNGILGGVIAHKNDALVHFWKGALIEVDGKKAPDLLGKMTDARQLPSKKVFTSIVRQAMKLNDDGTATPKRPTKPKKELVMPNELMAAIRKNKKAHAAYEKFSPSHQREYVEWIVDAKREQTRAKRIAQAVEWMAEGKPRNWKYM